MYRPTAPLYNIKTVRRNEFCEIDAKTLLKSVERCAFSAVVKITDVD